MKKSLIFKTGTVISGTDIIGTPFGIPTILLKAASILIIHYLNTEIGRRNYPIQK